jgi:hypothetical protein
VNVGLGVSVSFVAGDSVAVAPAGRLQASAARLIKSTDSKVFLFFTSMGVLL